MVGGEGNPSGRERAIETLIDMEPQGAFYRVTRVLDEVVPHALLNRPNVVTKAALVEQANGLSEHEITLANYDAAFGSESSVRNSVASASTSLGSGKIPASVEVSSKERILRHHKKQCNVLEKQRKPSGNAQTVSTSTTCSSTNSTPSPQLVSALRQVYGSATEDTSTFNFRRLLKAVMDHKVFETARSGQIVSSVSSTQTASSSTAVSTTDAPSEGNDSDDEGIGTLKNAKGGKENGKASIAQVETLLANVCRLNDEKVASSMEVIQGLLVTALCVLSQKAPNASLENEAENSGGNKKNKGDVGNPNNKGSITKRNKKAISEDPSVSPAVQVGSLLFLLKLDDASSEIGNNNETDGFQVDQALIDYFGHAAVAYEGRIEIQKARLLAKLQQEAEEADAKERLVHTGETSRVDSPAANLGEVGVTHISSDERQDGNAGTNSIVASKRSNNSSSSSSSSSNNNNSSDDNTNQNQAASSHESSSHVAEQLAIAEGDAAADHLERLAEATLTTAAALEQIIASATVEETSSGAEVSSRSGSGSGSDSDVDDNDGVESHFVGSTNDQEAGEAQEPIPSPHATDDDEEDCDAEGDGESSSSSSSSGGDWALMEDNDGRRSLRQQHDANEIEGEDDDVDGDDVLQQALALSLSEHDNRLAGQEGGDTGQEGGDIATGNAQGDHQTIGTQSEHGETDLRASTNNDEEALEISDGRPPVEGSVKAVTGEGDESLLPSLPSPPPAHRYASLLGHSVGSDMDQSQSIDEQFASYFDPSVLTKFGSIPTCNVLVHLLRYTAGVIKKNKFLTSNDTGDPAGDPNFACPGGIGVSLFGRNELFTDQNKGKESSKLTESADIPVTLQLLVALFLQLMEQRNVAMDGLRRALAQEEEHAQGEDSMEESVAKGDSNEDNTPLSSEEEDDPAVALAMNYAEEAIAESSESLEAKGMRRKAAAAAHDAAALLSLHRRRTESWKKSVKLYSICAVYALRSLRLFLQSTVRQRLREREYTAATTSLANECSDYLPSLVGSKLSMSLASLMSINSYNVAASLLSDEGQEVNDVLMPLNLYKEAVTTWGECVPLMYPSVNAQVEILRSLVSEFSPSLALDGAPHFRQLESLTTMPSLEIEPQVHRLQYLCKRLRVADILDNLVPNPTCYLPDGKSAVEHGVTDHAKLPKSFEEPFRASPLVSLIASTAKDICGGKGELHRLFLALCHRFNSRILLWSAFFESSENDVEDVAGAAVAQSSTATGDMVRVSSSPSSGLQFDATKCSDSIAILGDSSSGGNGSSVHQRASKVWGATLSTQHFSPKTGVHRWAVRLDKCERGHVFVGVATTQASMRTYVGGDKYGWGMIGTQALWHDRRKIRGDYGATFRTGSTIIVTLDSDAGTLSFSSWKDNNTSSSFSFDPLMQNQSGTRRQGHVSGTVEDWGVAFEGLPLDSKLYPAVGLYQRDDRVTLLSVESSSGSSGRDGGLDITGGICFYPDPASTEDSTLSDFIMQVRRFNDTLSWEGVQYVLEILKYIAHCLDEGRDELVPSKLLPSLAAALCLVPNSIPIISERFALTVLPHLLKFISKLEHYRSERQIGFRLFRTGMKSGKWIIRATGSSGESADFEEYVVDVSSTVTEDGVAIGFEGTGVGTTGKSKNGLVEIFGTTQGSSVHFVEEWSDGNDEGFGSSPSDETSSCVVAARLSLDGTKFEGAYRNVQFGTTGQIAGIYQTEDSTFSKLRLKDAPASSKQSAELADGLVMGQTVLCLACNHMSTIVGEDAASDQIVDDRTTGSKDAVHQASVQKLLSKKLLCRSSYASSETGYRAQFELLRKQYRWHNEFDDAHGCHNLELLDASAVEEFHVGAKKSIVTTHSEDIESKVAALDAYVSKVCGGMGSLRKICSEKYDETKKQIICAFIRPCNLEKELADSNSEALVSVWRSAVKIMEDGLRGAMAKPKEGQSRKDACVERCRLYNKISDFILSLDFWEYSSVSEAARDMTLFYRTLKFDNDFIMLRKEMEARSRRSLLRLISVQQIVSLITRFEKCGRDVDNFVAAEALVVGVPRLLGRNRMDSLLHVRKRPNYQERSRGLASKEAYAAGFENVARLGLRNLALSLFQLLGRLASRAIARRSQCSIGESLLSIDSLLVSVLTVFTITLKNEDLNEVINRSGIVSIIRNLTQVHRETLVPEEPFGSSKENISAVKILQKICQRELSRSTLRASVAASHALIFQISNSTACLPAVARGEVAGRNACLDLLYCEVTDMIDSAEKSVLKDTSEVIAKRIDSDWEKWSEICCSAPSSKKQKHNYTGGAGLAYLQENGTTLSIGLLVTNQKSSSRQKSAGAVPLGTSVRSVAKLSSGFVFHLLSQWFHILCGVLSTEGSLSLLVKDLKWASLLLEAVGLKMTIEDGSITSLSIREDSRVLLPGRFRSRALRFLFRLLEPIEPNEKVVFGLLQLAGFTSPFTSTNLDEDERIVCREAVTLLRRLHSPTQPGWRRCVNNVIIHVSNLSSGIGNHEVEMSPRLRLGVMSFVSGALETIGRGSYVLLKPAAAVPLSLDQQSSSSSKGHSSGAGSSGNGVSATPHHIVGNGTEGVVAGLCRHEASAGIVSNIDMKNGICEVVLLNRDLAEPDNSSDGSNTSMQPSGLSGSRNSLTVRALRTALSDVVQAQETPLYLDDAMTFDSFFGSCAESSLSKLFLTLKPDASLGSGLVEKSEVSNMVDKVASRMPGLTNVSTAIMLLRSAIVLLSDKRIASSFLHKKAGKEFLSEILCLAWPTEMNQELSDAVSKSQRRFLSSLPVHEARFSHLTAMLRDLSLRDEALSGLSEQEVSIRMKDLRSRTAESKDEEEKAKHSFNDNSEETKLQSSDGVSGTGRVPASSSGGAGNSDADSNSRIIESNSRGVSQSTINSNSDDDDEEESEAAATAAAHLREAAIAQMAELGLPRSWSELALRRTGGNDIEAAVHFCLERGGEMERLLAEERERDRLMQRQTGGAQASRRSGYRSESGSSNQLLRQLLEMGFPSRWCAEALAATGNNVDEALTWILTHGERLSEEDEAMADEDDGEDVDEEEDESIEEDEDDEDEAGTDGTIEAPTTKSAETDPGVDTNKDATPVWKGSVVPLRFISGRSIIDSKTLAISGLPTGGFSSVGTKGVLLCSGKWYYEAILETAGCLQIGWADGSFAGHCHADRGDGTGDGPSSWAFDGWRRYRWHSTATEWGCRWKEGDVVGCLVDMDSRTVSFTLNGKAEEVGMGVAFSGEGFRPCGGVYACVSFNRREKLRLRLSKPFKHPPPPGFKGVGEAVLESVHEWNALTSKEQVLDGPSIVRRPDPKRFLCDFSDGEHGHELMAWAHRYYGSDASVHLGSGRSKQSSTSPKSSATTLSGSTAVTCVSRRVEEEWKKSDGYSTSSGENAILPNRDDVLLSMRQGYIKASSKLDRQLVAESSILAILFARKLILHMIVALGEDFDLAFFVSETTETKSRARQLWGVIETCASLQCAGWVGEAGAMALAAEALGLGISSNDHGHSRQTSSERCGIASIADLDEGILIPTSGSTQLLSSVMRADPFHGIENRKNIPIPTGSLLAACAEAAIGSDGGGGVLVFLQRGLQSAVCSSKELRNVFTAALRRSVRLLAVVEYEGDDSDPSDQIEDDADPEKSSSVLEKSPTSKDEDSDSVALPDARLTSFLTGLLMSRLVEASLPNLDYQELLQELFQAWSVGMLSASLPWRMVCAFTVGGILNKCPEALRPAVSNFPTLARFYGRLESTVARRVWAERAAMPVCSRYVQAMIELLAAVKRAVKLEGMPSEFTKSWGKIAVDAATPLPVSIPCVPASCREAFWESDDGWISSDTSWEVWTGSVEYMPVDWETPTRSPVRSLMDGGEGPPMLREGCHVMRGVDWSSSGSGIIGSDDDGKKLYEAEKAKREKDKKRAEEEAKETDNKTCAPEDQGKATATEKTGTLTEESVSQNPASEIATTEKAPVSESADELTASDPAEDASKKKAKKKLPSPKLPVGTVLSIESWNGMPGLARRVRWHLTGEEGVYRFGGDGGRYDICHVEINEKGTRVKKRHPIPESAEQCAARHGFGARKKYSVILRLQRYGIPAEDDTRDERRSGILEWPDFGAGVRVDCTIHSDGAITLSEKELIYGSKNSGWEARFGQPSFVSGSFFVLSPLDATFEGGPELTSKSAYSSFYQELQGSNTYDVVALRNREDGKRIRVTSEMRLLRGRQNKNNSLESGAPVAAPMPPPIHFDPDYHASSLSLSRDGRTVSCVSSDGRGAAFASIGFNKGIHYWEVKLEQADIGSVFIGVAEKPSSSGSGGSYDTPPRLNRWPGWGFVNFRATYSSGAERVYGAHCHAGDTVGVLLDCDAGRVSFFFDGLKYGEHILNDLGCAFENLSPFGFNVDGCGSGGAGQGAPSGIEGGRGGRYPAQGCVKPRALWPVIGLRNQGDRVTLSPKWSSSYGVDGVTSTRNVLAIDEILFKYAEPVGRAADRENSEQDLPDWFVREAFAEYQRWQSCKWKRATTRGSGPYRHSSFGLDVDLDASPLACAAASAALGLRQAMIAGDRIRLPRSAGRILELAEEAIILGAHQGRLYYQIVSQKSEGGSLTEGGGRAWFLDESEVVDGLPYVGKGKAEGINLPLLDRFKCLSTGGLKISYEGGAVVRSDLEIIDGSLNLGVIPVNTIIPQKDVLERRVNSCGVTRFRVRTKMGEELKEGWISSRIRGGKEEAIVEALSNSFDDGEARSFATALDSALVWKKEFDKKNANESSIEHARFTVSDISEFKRLLGRGRLKGLSAAESDSVLASTVSAVSDFSESGDAVECNFDEIVSALDFAVNLKRGVKTDRVSLSPGANQAAAYMLASVNEIPSTEALAARVAMIRAFNRRARLALPLMSIRPCQEGSAIFGGLCGHGASTERSGRSRLIESQARWVQVPSIATRIRSLRGLFFGSVKKGLLESITEATATPTPLSHDEYELPREIRTVRINRLRSRIAMGSTDNGAKRKYCVFAQLYNETKGWGGAALRRGYVAKGHGGQRRAFKVKLIGEGVNDYSGPYREAFTDAFAEVLDVDPVTGRGSLGVLDPTPNRTGDIGENRDLFMFSLNGKELPSVKRFSDKYVSSEERRIRKSFSSLTAPRDEPSREVEEALVFLGRITGTAYRHGIPVDLPLPLKTVWEPIVEEASKEEDQLRELDELAYKQRDSSELPPLLSWQHRMLNAFVEGMSNVLPAEILTLMKGEELRDLVCGNKDVDVDLLRSVVEYEGYAEDDEVISYFWNTLRELSNEERKLFLQFVWARNRLPLKKSDFEAPFKIQRDGVNSAESADQALPSASTCFFSLALPEYSNKDILKEKLLFAINNVTTMETDFQTNSAEIAEGYRTLAS